MSSPDLIAAAVFILITVTIYVLVQRVIRNAQADDLLQTRLEPLPDGLSHSPRKPVDPSLSEALAHQVPQSEQGRTKLAEDLHRAGFYRPTSLRTYLAIRNSLIILGLVITGTVAVLIGPEQPIRVLQVLLVGGILTALCWGIPRIYVALRGARRVRNISRSLPFVMDMIAMCLSAGLSLPQALAYVVREIHAAHPELACELAIFRQQADVTSFEMALRQLSRRVDVPEIVAMVALMTQGRQLGTDIGNSMREYADNIRLRWRQTADERSSKTSVTMLFPIVLCLLPAAFIFLWGPAVLDLVNFMQDFNRVSQPELLGGGQ